MTKEELAQKIKDSNYTCDGINCKECISVNGFNCCLQCDKKLFVSLVLPAKSKKDKLEKRIEELEQKLEQTEKDLADYQFNYPTIKELEKENAKLKEKLKPENCLKLLAKEGYIKFTSEHLTKATEIIKGLYFIIQSRIDYKNNIEIADEMWRAEQFLKEE